MTNPKDSVQEAQEALEDVIDNYADDMTGQDGEEAINRAARDLVAARDAKLRHDDPEGYAERKAMGCL